MCRVMGISYGPNREDLDTAEIAAILYPALVHQGPHAWGWMSYNETSEEVRWEKTPGFCDTKAAYKQQMKTIDPDAKWWVGHVRFATHGKPEDNRNNHPIPHDNIIGVHNGVLRNHGEILKVTGREDPKTLVDSEAIFAAVNKWGPKKGLAKIRGDMVTIYTDFRKPHVLHLARTHGRQVTIGWTEKGNIIFASEEQALRKLEPEIKFVKFSVVSENRLLIIRNGKIIQKIQFAPRTVRYTPPPASITRGVDKDWEDLQELRARDRMTRRGEFMFPRELSSTKVSELTAAEKDALSTLARERKERRAIRSKTGRNRQVLVPTEIVEGDGKLPKHEPKKQPNQNQKLYYYNGELLTHAEYVECIESEGGTF